MAGFWYHLDKTKRSNYNIVKLLKTGETSMETSITEYKDKKSAIYDPAVWNHMKGMAETFSKSGALPSDENAAKLVMKMQTGYEMGMTPIESIKSFYFVRGTINIFGSAVIRRLREHGWKIEYKDGDDSCTARISKGKEVYEDTLTFEQAQKSKWTHVNGNLKPGWYEGANRKLKLRYGVVSQMLKTYVPEVLGSATDIAEVAMDAAPLYDPEMVVEDKPVTEDQLKTLKTLGYEGEQDITFIEAKNTIKELMEQE